MNELNKSWGEPWITPFTPKVLGNLRSMINQYADGTSTILVPKSRSFSQPINSQVAMLPPTETPTSTPTASPTECPTNTPPTDSPTMTPTETMPTVSPTPTMTPTETPTETMHTHTPSPTPATHTPT